MKNLAFCLRQNVKERGVSLVELLLVVAAIGFLILLVSNLPNAINLIGRARHQSLAREIASKSIEDTRAIAFANLADGTTNLTDSRVNLLPSGSGARIIEPCNPNVCTGGEASKVKQVAVTLTWKEAGKTQTVKLQTLISEGGLNQ